MCYLDVHGLSGNSIAVLIAATLASTGRGCRAFGGEVYACIWPLIGVKFPSPRLSRSVEWNGGMELQI